jgi:hypothetical protein
MTRLDAELKQLSGWFGSETVDFVPDGQWVRLIAYRIPGDLWRPDRADIAFQIPDPPAPPYGFYGRPLPDPDGSCTGLALVSGAAINNYTFPATTPWGSDWGLFSWQIEDFLVAEPLNAGNTMLDFARSFADRFREGS